jgi:hypothetical protein
MHQFDEEDIQLSRRLDDPGQEQLPDHLVSVGGLAEPTTYRSLIVGGVARSSTAWLR